jgi:translation initiation factor 1A
MPNKKGGKAYKKGKGDQETGEKDFIEILPDQYMARAIRVLGDRNVLCYCHDNVLRICHICRRMKGKVWVEPGDMVLVSLRDFTGGDPKTVKRGDILAKYAPEQMRQLKKDGVNPRLFMKLDGCAGINLDELGVDKTDDTRIVENGADDGFDFESGDDEEEEEEGAANNDDESKVVPKKDKKSHGRGTREVRDVSEIVSSEAGDRAVNVDDL